MKANEVIMIGRSRSWQASSVASRRGTPASRCCLGELDDQDRVLAGQADQHDEADLREDVDVHPRHDARRPSEQSRHIGTTRITASGSDQLSYWAASTRNTSTTARSEDAAWPCCRSGAAGRASSVHSSRIDSGQVLVGDDRLHQRDGLAGADPGAGVAVDGGGGVHVVADDHHRAADVRERRPACPSGTMSPSVVADLAAASRSSTCLRKAASAWTLTCQVRPKRLKSLTYSEPR